MKQQTALLLCPRMEFACFHRAAQHTPDWEAPAELVVPLRMVNGLMPTSPTAAQRARDAALAATEAAAAAAAAVEDHSAVLLSRTLQEASTSQKGGAGACLVAAGEDPGWAGLVVWSEVPVSAGR